MRTPILFAAAFLLAACAPSLEVNNNPAQTVTETVRAPAATVTAAPQEHAPPADATTVASIAECIGMDPVGFEDLGTLGGYVMTARFSCEVRGADGRASGTETFTIVADVYDPAVGGPFVLEDASLVTGAGTWSGSGSGVMDLACVTAAAQYVEPCYLGEVVYSGGGDLAGLEFHLYFAGMQGELAHVGWIADVAD